MSPKARFDKLLEPGQIGKVQTRNRMVKTGAGMSYGVGTPRCLSFYEALAKGGVGLIMVETTGVDYPLGVFSPWQLHMDDDKYIASFNKVTDVIHKHGCPTFVSLFHAGGWHSSFTGLQPVSSSTLTESEMPIDNFKMAPRGLTVAEIEEIINKFINAAERAQKAGFDGVEFNAATHHLFNSFLSRFWNRRQDDYGCGSLETRARFLVEVIRGTKKRLGQDFPVSVIISGAEFGLTNGITPEESQGFARLIEKASADVVHVRAYGYDDYFGVLCPETIFYPEPPKPLAEPLDSSQNGEGATVPLAAGIKKAVSIPVISVGRLNPILGEKILQQGKVDFVGFTRRLLADPELPNKVAAGRLEDITPCMACAECLRAYRLESDIGVKCRVNASLGSDQEYEIKPAEKKKRVMVAGSGPAGMEAAMVAALRGHEVMLYEKEHILGGSLPLSAIVKDVDIKNCIALVSYLKTQITKLGVRIKLGQEVNPSVLEDIKPDVVILATGGIPSLPEIPGIGGRNVVKMEDLHRGLKRYLRFLGPNAVQQLSRVWMPIGKRVVVIGGSIHSCQLAEFLVKRGRKVTIVDTGQTLGDEMTITHKIRLFRWLVKKGTTLITGAKYEGITNKGLTITTREGEKMTIEADTIVPAVPLSADDRLLKNLEGKVPEIYQIGDCREPHLILEAIADGWHIAQAL